MPETIEIAGRKIPIEAAVIGAGAIGILAYVALKGGGIGGALQAAGVNTGGQGAGGTGFYPGSGGANPVPAPGAGGGGGNGPADLPLKFPGTALPETPTFHVPGMVAAPPEPSGYSRSIMPVGTLTPISTSTGMITVDSSGSVIVPKGTPLSVIQEIGLPYRIIGEAVGATYQIPDPRGPGATPISADPVYHVTVPDWQQGGYTSQMGD